MGKHTSFNTLIRLGLIALLFSIFFINEVNAQVDKSVLKTKTAPSLLIESRIFYGFLNNYHNELRIFNAHIPAFELSLLKSTTGKKSWEKIYNYPQIGISVFYSPFNSSDALGNAFGLYSHINFPLLKSQKQALKFRLGLGMAYLDAKFDPINNYQNLAIGSSLNAMIHFLLDYKIELNTRNSISAGLSLIHFSNASIVTPNYGLNMPMISMAYTYKLEVENEIAPREAYPLFKSKKTKGFRLDFQVEAGIKSQNDVFETKYAIFTQSLTVLKAINLKSSMGLGLDYSWDASNKNLFIAEGLAPPSNLGLAKYGLTANYEIRLEKLAMKLGLGTYLHSKDKTEGPIYEKLALNYLVYKNIYVGLELKAHAAKAAYISWGFGYQLHLNSKKK